MDHRKDEQAPWNREHAATRNAFTLSVISIIFAFISVGMATYLLFVTMDLFRASDTNTQIQVARVAPVIAFSTQSPIRYAKRYDPVAQYVVPDSALDIYNVGELGLRQLRVDVKTMAVFAWRNMASQQDTARHRLPVHYWFARDTHRFPPGGKGLIASLGPTEHGARMRLWTQTSDSLYPPVRLSNLVQLVKLRYRDILDNELLEFYLVSPWTYSRIDSLDGEGLWGEMEMKEADNNYAYLWDAPDTLAIATLARKAQEHLGWESVFRQHPDFIEPDSIFGTSYPTQKRFPVPGLWRR